jgi:predicted NAD/FAD-dependent oxidoreductase
MTERVAVVGAGLAGLVAAGRIAAGGAAVTIFDKSRGLGGRLATRRTPHGTFDHGAPVVHCENWQLAPLEARAACQRWGDLGHVGLPGMSGLVRPLAEEREVRTEAEVAGLEAGPAGVVLRLSSGASEGPFARVVLAIPAPQAARVAAGLDGAEALGRVAMAPVWTLMAAFGDRPDLPDLLRPGGAIELVVRDAAKPGRTGETWVAHAAHDWTRARLDLPAESVLPALLAEFDDLAQGRLPRPVHVAAHRWRFALTERALGQPFAALAGGAVIAGGDWALGARAEHAWLSGQAVAEAVLAQGAGG